MASCSAALNHIAVPLQASPFTNSKHGGLRLDRSCQLKLPTGSQTRELSRLRAEANQVGTPSQESQSPAPAFPRRQLLLPAAATVLLGSVPAGAALADAVTEEAPTVTAAPTPSFEAYENKTEQYTLLVPAEWSKGEGQVGTRKLVAFHPEDTTQTNVSVLITPLGADFTSLGSFGTVDAFAEALVNGLDRSYLRKPGQAARLINAKSTGSMYYVEYTIQKPGENKIHLLSAVAINFNGIYNQLYTVTAQYLEDESTAYEETIRKVVNSFAIKK